MSEASKKPSGKLIGLAVVVLIAAGAFFGVSWWEKEQAQKVAAFLNTQGDYTTTSIKVGFWDKSIVLTGMKGKSPFIKGATAFFEAEAITISGANFDAFKSKGVVPLADSVALTNFKMNVEYPAQGDAPSIKEETTVKSIAATKVRGDALELEEMGKKTQNLNDPAVLARYFASSASIRAATADMTGYALRMDMGLPSPVVLGMDSFQGKDYGMLALGPSSWTNFTLSFMGQEVFKVRSMSSEQMSMPDLYTPIFSADTPPKEGRETPSLLSQILAKLEKDPLVMRGVVLNDVSARFLLPETITMKRCAMDLELGAEKLSLREHFEDLVLPPSYYRYMDGEAAQLAETYAAPLNFSGAVDLLATQKDGKGEVRFKDTGLAEKDLGAVRLDLGLLFGAPGADSLRKLLETNPEWLLKDARFVLEDKELLNITLDNRGEGEPDGKKPENQEAKGIASLRAEAARELRAEAEKNSNPDMKALLAGLANLVERPGALTINLNPEKPLPLDAFDSMDEGSAGLYRVTTQFTPAQ